MNCGNESHLTNLTASWFQNIQKKPFVIGWIETYQMSRIGMEALKFDTVNGEHVYVHDSTDFHRLR